MFDYADYEEEFGPKATPSEAVAEFGRNAGMDNPDRAWLLHDWDVWVRNPYYQGPPVPHPESDEGYNDDGEPAEAASPDVDPVYRPGSLMSWGPRNADPEGDDIPF
jgi:hypothetical protein